MMKLGNLVCIGSTRNCLGVVCVVEQLRPDGVTLWVINGHYRIELSSRGIFLPERNFYWPEAKILYIGPMLPNLGYNDLFEQAQPLCKKVVPLWPYKVRWFFAGKWGRFVRAWYEVKSSWNEPLEYKKPTCKRDNDDIPF